MNDVILTVIVPLLAAGFGYLFKEARDRKKILQSEIYKEKREMYQWFVDLIIGMLENVKTGKDAPLDDLNTSLFSFYKKYILYASPSVINAFSDYFQFLYHKNSEQNHKAHFTALSKVLAAMREDLGLSNQELGENGKKMFRAMITDFDTMM